MSADDLDRAENRASGCWRTGLDRRGFLRVAAAIPAALTAAEITGADAKAGKTQSADVPMPQIQFGRHQISRLIVGCHNIDGGSHMSPFMDVEMHNYYTPDRAVQTLRHCEEVGINTWQGHERGTLLGIYQRLRKSGSKMNLLGLTHFKEVEKIATFAKIDGLIGLAHHGESTDVQFKAGKLDTIYDCLKCIRDTGLMVGVSTHIPDVVDAIESKGWDIDYYQTCVYERHRDAAALKKLLGQIPLPIGEVFLQGDPPRMFKMIQQTKRICLAFKILAAGRRQDVETAFRETFAAIKPSDAVIVGIYDRYSDQAGQNAAFVRRYGTRS